MPSRLLRPCVAYPCGELVDKGACPQHRRERERNRGSAVSRGYDAAHKRWATAILSRDPWCRGCDQAPSRHADHIIRIERGGEKYTGENGQGLCASCHSYKTATEEHDVTFGPRLIAEGAKTGEPTPCGWRHLPGFGGYA